MCLEGDGNPSHKVTPSHLMAKNVSDSND